VDDPDGADVRIYQEEIFGPVPCFVRVETYDEAVALINAHVYCNGVSVFTRDGDAARSFVQHIQVCMVGVNIPIPVPLAFHSLACCVNKSANLRLRLPGTIFLGNKCRRTISYLIQQTGIARFNFISQWCALAIGNCWMAG
jgi:hypothetical protein